MGDKLALEDVDDALQQFRQLSQVVDSLVKQRAVDGPFTLVKPTYNPDAILQPEDFLPRSSRGLALALARSKGIHDAETDPPYPHAKAAAAEVARLTSANSTKRGPLRASSRPATQQTQQSAQRSASPAPPGPVPGSATTGVQALLALPGQLPYRKLLATAKRSRAAEAQAFADEVDELDAEIDKYLLQERSQRSQPGAALVLQTAWRARGPRLLFNGYYAQRCAAQQQIVRTYLAPWRQLVGAVQHHRHRVLRSAFREWKALGDLKTLLFYKVLKRLKASMIDVRDSQSPNHLWRLCTAPGEDPWSARIGLGPLCCNMILGQYPWRKLRSCFSSWQQVVQAKREQRGRAVAVLEQAERNRSRDQLHTLFRFWYRWAMIKLSERLNIAAPLFRPRLDIWDVWLWEHMRSTELQGRIVRLHRGFRMRHCFMFWRGFAARNRKLRQAWMAAAVPQIEALMRYALGCLKANWRQNKSQRRTRNCAFKEWLRLARRNVLVRKIARQAEQVSRMAIQKLHFRRLRQWANMSKLLNASATIQMLQRRPLCMIPLCAWTGDHTNMWFVAAWHAWRSFAVGRIRMRCWLAAHLHRTQFLGLDLVFKAWRKVTELQLQRTAWVCQHPAAPGGHQLASPGRGSVSPSPAGDAMSVPHDTPRTPSPRDTPGTPPQVELPEGSVQVTCADFPLGAPWRPLVPSAHILRTLDATTTGINPAVVTKLIQQLVDVEGPFLPEADEEQTTRQLVLEVCEREEVSHAVRHLLDEDATHNVNLWLHASSPPDPWVWQRLVGLAVCRAQPHPECPCGPLVDHESLPWAAEVGSLRLRQGQAIQRLQLQLPHSSRSDGQDPEAQVTEDKPGLAAVRPGLLNPTHRSATIPTEDEQELLWLHKLALAEDLLEGCAGVLLRVGYRILPFVYDTLRHMAPERTNIALKQGDLLVYLLEGALHHDQTFMAAAKHYRANRDRVITMGMSLHKHAMALNRHCPEFSLTYPSYNPNGTWQEIMERVDQEDPEAPSPPRIPTPPVQPGPVSGFPESAPLAQPALLGPLPRGSPTGQVARTVGSPKSKSMPGPVRPVTSTALSTTERIKMEMMGLSPPDTAPAPLGGLKSAGSSVSGSRQGTPPTPSAAQADKRGASPPRAATPPRAQIPDPNAAAPEDSINTELEPAPSRGISLILPKPMSLEDMQAKGVVLGAAAAAILAAKAAAAKRAQGGHRVNQAEVAQILAKPTQYKAAWRPSGYRKVEPKSKERDVPLHTPKIKRLPPLPELRSMSPKHDRPDEFASGFYGGNGMSQNGVSAAGAGGTAAGDAAFRAMMAASNGPAQPATESSSRTASGIQMPGTQTTPAGQPLQGSPGTGREPQTGQLCVHQASAPPRPRQPSPPPAPYHWFGPEGRLFRTVADVPRPQETPSMHELHHRANKLNAERLESSLFSLPLLPAIIFSDWGNPPTPRARSPATRGRSPSTTVEVVSSAPDSALSAGQELVAQVPKLHFAEQGVGSLLSSDAHGGSADALVSPASAPSRVASLKQKADEVIHKLDLGNLFEPQEAQEAKHPTITYRASLGENLLSQDTKPARVSDIGAVTQALDLASADRAVCDLSDDNQDEALDSSRLTYIQAKGMHRTAGNDSVGDPPAARKPAFIVTPEQLNIYLGGHMRTPVRTTTDTEDCSVQQAQLLSGTDTANSALLPDSEFDAQFNAARVVATPTTRHRALLDNYDLRSELRDLLGAEAAAAVIAGAEDALLGAHQLTLEEQEAVNAELERLEAELSKGTRYRRRSPHRLNRSPLHASTTHSSRAHSMSGATSRNSTPVLPSDWASVLAPVASNASVSSPPRGGAMNSIRNPSPSRFQQEQQAGAQSTHPELQATTAESITDKTPKLALALVSPHQIAAEAAAITQRDRLLQCHSPESPSLRSVSVEASYTRTTLRDQTTEQQGEARTASPQQPLSATQQQPSPRRSSTSPVRYPSPVKQDLVPGPHTDTTTSTTAHVVAHTPRANTLTAEVAQAHRPGSVSPWVEGEQDSDIQLLHQASRPGTGTGTASAGVLTSSTPQDTSRPAQPTLSASQLPLIHSRSSQTVEQSQLFPDRPHSSGSELGPGSVASYASSGGGVRTPDHARHGARDQEIQISVYDSMATADVLGGHLPDVRPDDLGSPSNMFAQSSSGAQRTRRKSNLRSAATVVAPTLPPDHPICDQQSAGGRSPSPAPRTEGVGTLGSVPEDLDEDSALELEALRAMWCSAPYSGPDNGPSLPHPDSTPAAAISQIIAEAAEADWQRYEAAAGQLVEQLSTALSQRETLNQVTPLALEGAQPSSPLSAPGRSSGQATGTHQLQRALSLMEDTLAASIDPERLTGFNVSSYPDNLSDLMGRLVVAPMATRYLFWKKVQSISQLKQRVMEDRALDDQLRSLAWASTFQTGHAAIPSGSTDPKVADSHALAAPTAAATGAPLGLVKPAGWSSGALALATARRVPWASPLPTAAPSEPQTAVMTISQPITLRRRDDTAQALISQVDAPVVGTGPSTLPRTPTFVTEVPQLLLPADGSGRPSDTSDRRFFPLQGQEALAHRLARLLDARRADKEASALSEPLLTDRSSAPNIKNLDEEEAEVAVLSDMTIALHRDMLARHHQRIGHSSNAALPGKGQVSGWAPPAVLPPGYTGRDGFHDTTDPFTYPARPRECAVPNPLPRVTLKGVSLAHISLHRQQAEALAHAAVGTGLSMAITTRSPTSPGSVPLQPCHHLPCPTGQERPTPSRLQPLSPVASPPAHPTSESQPGNIIFVTPHAPAYVSFATRCLDNVFTPGAHSVGSHSPQHIPSPRSVIENPAIQDDAHEYVDGKPWTPTLSNRSTPLMSTRLQAIGEGSARSMG